MGDWLYMSAFETSLAERSLPILDILTSVTRKMTEGEILQLTLLGDAEISEAQYFDVLKRKTAYLFSASCEIGRYSVALEKQQMALRDYGLSLGTAFQLIDDLLDFTSSEERLGKAAGADLLGGKVTLPLIYLRRTWSQSRGRWSRRCCVKGNTAASSKRICWKPSAALALSNRPVPALTSTRKRARRAR